MPESLLDKIRKAELLPSPPLLAMKVMELVRCDAPAAQIAQVISSDSALAAKLLKTANSSFYKRSHTVSTISHAIVVLGLEAVRTLVLGFSLVTRLQARKTRSFDYLKYWRRSLYASVAARALATRLKIIQREECSLAALLADVGMLALDQVHQEYGDLCRTAQTHADLADIEMEILGFTHADASAALAIEWKLPSLLGIPMACHHRPDRATDAFGQKIATLVNAAGLCADVFLSEASAEALLTLRDTCQQHFAIAERDCDAILEEVATAAIEASALFEIPPLGPIDLLGIAVNAAALRLGASPKSFAHKPLDTGRKVA